ncbi:LamG domain-containing protein [Candidatus Poribacteria bacterium]|nr:LamG domain-containing protein [Candidatus Poribacteria bacterium]
MNRRISLTCLGLVLAWSVGTAHAAIDASALVGLWMFDDGKGDIAVDGSGNKRDAKLIKEPKWGTGKFGKAIELSFATGNYAIAPIVQSASMSVVAWAKYTDLPTTNSGIAHVQADEAQDGAPESKTIGIWVENTGLLWGRFIPAGGGNVNLPKNQKLDKDKWYHVAVVLSDKDKKGRQYVDGKMVGDADYPGKLNPVAFIKIGRQGNESWTGLLDEVAVFGKALSEDEIKSIMGGFEAGLAVSPGGKAASTWGALKSE